mmetsp:Transcript_30312/g.66660  ORF Transcript_30312/g.66660 Transcript_30312/m.66660 type:complete len:151 (+) Transcript_30312:103-555(+)|eukprot:CAMPEP_0178506646 /NCGR_PEP_ID=MMETSP0696-20121128/19790_1 /TAXON_ID=265572 /ORGANISM="Extubocellulus spinifer, Strain CCMP396" /LENGTH=150 /DNA_ID=CAMNT_0020136067 /DNA_START=15 /DNA_END=467 /DNA_ORIENTATION=-
MDIESELEEERRRYRRVVEEAEANIERTKKQMAESRALRGVLLESLCSTAPSSDRDDERSIGDVILDDLIAHVVAGLESSEEGMDSACEAVESLISEAEGPTAEATVRCTSTSTAAATTITSHLRQRTSSPLSGVPEADATSTARGGRKK